MNKEEMVKEMRALIKDLPEAETITQAKLNELVINTVDKCIQIVKKG